MRFAAAIAASMHTLQRRLSELGLSYSAFVQEVRIETAIELLGNRDVKLLEVVGLLGDQDPIELRPRKVRRHRLS